MSGWIKLHRSLRDWEWYDDHNTTRLLIHLLITVNYEDKKWKGITVKAGSMVISWENLSNEIGLSIQQCRTSMAKLEKCEEITRFVTSKYQVVTLCKWEKLQSEHLELTAKRTGKQQANNKQITTTKESKEIKEDKKEVLHTSINDEIEMFLNWFNGQCQILKGKKGSFQVLSNTDKNNFKTLKSKYTQEDFFAVAKAMAKNKWVIENKSFNPQHFLRVENFNRYLGQSESNIETGTAQNPLYNGRG